MAGRKGARDPRIGLMIRGFYAILDSVPTEQRPEPHGPLTLDEIDQAAQWMKATTAEIQAERKSPPAD